MIDNESSYDDHIESFNIGFFSERSIADVFDRTSDDDVGQGRTPRERIVANVTNRAGDVDTCQARAPRERPLVDSSDGISGAVISDIGRDGDVTAVRWPIRRTVVSHFDFSVARNFSKEACVIDSVNLKFVFIGGSGYWQQKCQEKD